MEISANKPEKRKLIILHFSDVSAHYTIAQKNVTVPNTILYYCTLQISQQVPKEECKNVPNVSCNEVPKEVEDEQCEQIPKEKCYQVEKKVTKQVPKEKCKNVPKEHCKDVPYKVPKQVLCLLKF